MKLREGSTHLISRGKALRETPTGRPEPLTNANSRWSDVLLQLCLDHLALRPIYLCKKIEERSREIGTLGARTGN